MEVQRLKISEQEIIEGNKVIAEIMDKLTGIGIPLSTFNKYHSSWNELMPVIKKLNGGRPHSAVLWEDITKALIDCDIERTWLAVVKYIKWFYKKQ